MSAAYPPEADGNADQTEFFVDTAPGDADLFVLTIEPEPDTDPGPSAVHVLGGGF